MWPDLVSFGWPNMVPFGWDFNLVAINCVVHKLILDKTVKKSKEKGKKKVLARERTRRPLSHRTG